MPILSLRFLDEPAYLRLGDDERYSYFATLRSRSDALAAIGEWGGSPDDLDALSADGVLVRFPAADEPAVRAVLDPLIVQIPRGAKPAPDGVMVLLPLPNGRACAIHRVTAGVLDTRPLEGLGNGVRAFAASSGMDEDEVWRSVVHDLTGVLTTGAGRLASAHTS